MWTLLLTVCFLLLANTKAKTDEEVEWEEIRAIFDNATDDELFEIKPLENNTLSEIMAICDFTNVIDPTRTINCQNTILALIADLQSKSIYNFNTWYLSYFQTIGKDNWYKNVLIKKHINSFSVFPAVNSTYVNTDNLQIYYQHYKKKSSSNTCKSPVVLLSAWGAVKEDWYDIAPILSKHRDVLTVDFRGTGQTGLGPTPGNYTAYQLATDIADLVTHVFGSVKPVIVGGTLGGKIALQSALDYEDLYDGIVPCGTQAGGSLGVNGPLRQSLFTLMISGAARLRWYQTARCIYHPTWALQNVERWLFFFVTGGIYNRPQAGILRQTTIATSFDISSRIGEIEMPVMVMHGTHDQIANYTGAKLLVNAIGDNAILQKLPNLGHVSWHMNETLFIDSVNFWLQNYIDEPCSQK